MQFLDRTLPTLAENLALDEALLVEAEAGRGGEVLRLWEWPRLGVVLGSGCKLADDVDEAACQADGVPVLRRASGGGTVLLGPGCLLYSVVLSLDRDPALAGIAASIEHILARVRAALHGLGDDVGQAGISDLVAGGRKFSGNAQQRKRRFLLHHGTLLYQFDLTRIGKYLRQPARQPDYRHDRPHADFVRNLAVDPAALRERLRTAWGAVTPAADWPADRVRQLVAEKYGLDEWNRRR